MKYLKVYSPRCVGFSPSALCYAFFDEILHPENKRRVDSIPVGEPMFVLEDDGSQNWVAVYDDWSFAIDLDTGNEYSFPVITQMRNDIAIRGCFAVIWNYPLIEVTFNDFSKKCYNWEYTMR